MLWREKRQEVQVIKDGVKTQKPFGPVGPATINDEVEILRRILKKAKVWAQVDEDELITLAEPETIGRALTREEIQRLLTTAASNPSWETAFLAAVIAVNSTKRAGDLKSLCWADVDLRDRKTAWVKKSKTAAGEGIIPMTPDALWAFGRLRQRAELFGPVEPSHFVFASHGSHQVAKRTPQEKRLRDRIYQARRWASRHGKPLPETPELPGSNAVAGAVLIDFDPTKPVTSWRTAWRNLTKKAGLPGFRFHDLRHTSITILAESGASDATIKALAGHVSQRMLERYSHIRMEAKRKAVKAIARGTAMTGYSTNRSTKAENKAKIGKRSIAIN